MDGSKCVRLITRVLKATTERKVAESNVKVHVIGLNAVQQSAKLAREGMVNDNTMQLLSPFHS